MKKYLLLLAMPLILMSCYSNNKGKDNAGAEEHTIIAEHVKVLVLDVKGMTCTGCEQSVQEAVGAVAGVTEVKANHMDSIATVSFDPGQASVEQISEAIANTGYTVTGFHFQEEEK